MKRKCADGEIRERPSMHTGLTGEAYYSYVIKGFFEPPFCAWLTDQKSWCWSSNRLPSRWSALWSCPSAARSEGVSGELRTTGRAAAISQGAVLVMMAARRLVGQGNRRPLGAGMTAERRGSLKRTVVRRLDFRGRALAAI